MTSIRIFLESNGIVEAVFIKVRDPFPSIEIYEVKVIDREDDIWGFEEGNTFDTLYEECVEQRWRKIYLNE